MAKYQDQYGTCNMMKDKAYMFFWHGQFMYYGTSIDTVVHAHHAIQIAISFDNPFDIMLYKGPSSLQTYAVIIGPDQPHECRTYGSKFLLINIDPESTIGKALSTQYLSEHSLTEIPVAKTSSFTKDLQTLLNNEVDNHSVHTLTQQFLNKLSGTEESHIIDERISAVLKILKQPSDNAIKVKDLAASVFISPSRLIHLFKSQVGIPIRKYILWSKLLLATQKIFEAKNIQEAALYAGFSDAAHFNRTFKKMFGLSPSTFEKNSQIVQAFWG